MTLAVPTRTLLPRTLLPRALRALVAMLAVALLASGLAGGQAVAASHDPSGPNLPNVPPPPSEPPLPDLPPVPPTPTNPPVTIEDYAPYEPQKRCAPRAKAGTKVLAAWLLRSFGGRNGAMSRSCRSGGISEHKEGRAVDWMLDARKPGDVARAQRFLDRAFATDAAGSEHALARRMGIMYVIWNDRIYSSYDHFAGRPYLSSSCKRRAKCSVTLRHRDHMHLSLSRAGAAGRTSWYAKRLAR